MSGLNSFLGHITTSSSSPSLRHRCLSPSCRCRVPAAISASPFHSTTPTCMLVVISSARLATGVVHSSVCPFVLSHSIPLIPPSTHLSPSPCVRLPVSSRPSYPSFLVPLPCYISCRRPFPHPVPLLICLVSLFRPFFSSCPYPPLVLSFPVPSPRRISCRRWPLSLILSVLFFSHCLVSRPLVLFSCSLVLFSRSLILFSRSLIPLLVCSSRCVDNRVTTVIHSTSLTIRFP